MVSELNVKLSFEDAVENMPALKRYVKSLVTNKASPKENVMSISKRCRTLLQNRAPEKMEDPGSFVLSCEIEGAVFEKSLCDLGSSVNLMPYTVAQRLGLTNFRSMKIQLVFADRSVRHPVGVILDIDVVIGNRRIPADFVVLELDQEPKDPLILGRPFLATTGAIIDVKKGKIDLHLGDIIMKFEVNKMLKRPTLDGHRFSIDHASEDDDEDDEEKQVAAVVGIDDGGQAQTENSAQLQMQPVSLREGFHIRNQVDIISHDCQRIFRQAERIGPTLQYVPKTSHPRSNILITSLGANFKVDVLLNWLAE
ncbi:hypothetical protein Bca4012_048572 [Brassica carinata]